MDKENGSDKTHAEKPSGGAGEPGWSGHGPPGDPFEPDGALAPAGQEEAGSKEDQPKRNRIWREVKSWLRDLLIAAAICVLLIVYVAQPFRVEKSSMEPLLHDGDRILVSKISLLYEPIRRGDVIVLWNPRDPEESWIKRVIGLPGETVRIERGIVYINGKPLAEPYISKRERIGRKNEYPPGEISQLVKKNPRAMREFGLVIRRNPGPGGPRKVAQHVPEGYYFVLGDHRTLSMDSRDSVFFPKAAGPGFIPARYIYGKALFRYWPLDKFGAINSAMYPEKKKGER